MALLLVIPGLDYLPEGAFAYERVNLVPVQELFTILYYVVMIVVVITIIV